MMEANLHRSRVIAAAIALAVAGVAAPMAGMFYLSWTRAVARERSRLTLQAERVMTRSKAVMAEASEALRVLNSYSGKACSAEHIAYMQAMTIKTRPLESVGHFEDGFLRCNSWNMTPNMVWVLPPDFVTEDGIAVTLNVRPFANPDMNIVAMHYGSYYVVINPTRFVDIVASPNIGGAITTASGIVVSSFNVPDPHLISDFVRNPEEKLSEAYLLSSVKDSGWIAVALTSREKLAEQLRQELMLLLPLGTLIAAFMVCIIVWFSRRQLSLLGQLEFAVENREFIVHYQPIIELRTRRCVGAEALVRWRRPDGTLVRPDFFIAIAEEYGLIMQITDQVIAAVSADLADTLNRNRSLHIAINLAADDIRTGRFLPVLQRTFQGSGVEPRQIWLEATERGFMNIDAARGTIERARSLGYVVAIDDFGTGFSSLSYLQDFPLDVLKIDKSFVDTLGLDHITSSVTPHIIDMAKTLNLDIVAEGVETEQQLDYLCMRGVNYAQGWLFSKPLNVEDFKKYLEANIYNSSLPDR